LKAKEIIELITQPPKVRQGFMSSRRWSLLRTLGCLLKSRRAFEGLCHISELSDGFVKNVDDVCRVGDLIPVKLLAIDDQGRFKLSRRAALAEMGEKKESDNSK